MARAFLDANIFIDLVEHRPESNSAVTSHLLQGYELYISPLAVHILMYVTKNKIPYEALIQLAEFFSIVPFDEQIMQKSLVGPTKDFEDNIQLHSAAMAECDLFLTHDKQLLAMQFFGKTQLAATLA